MSPIVSIEADLPTLPVTGIESMNSIPDFVTIGETSSTVGVRRSPPPISLAQWTPCIWSLALHGGILLLLMMWQMSTPPSTRDDFDIVVNTTVEEPEPVHFTSLDVAEPVRRQPTETEITYGTPGGRDGNGLPLAFAPVAAPSIGVPARSSSSLAAVLHESWGTSRGLSDRVASGAPVVNRTRGDGTGAGAGRGTGNGVGDGSATEFFGLAPIGKRIVYVLDSSKSMNRPHESEAGTRFKRVKLELLESVSSLPEESAFFILFFNDYCVSMPAPGLEAATLGAKQKYLTWMQQVIPVGNTEPSAALERALWLRPDLIYFLSDGDFDAEAREKLMRLPVTNAKLQTIAFEEPLSDAGRRAMELIEQNKIAAAKKLVPHKEFIRIAAAWRGEKFLKELSERHHGKLVLVP